jgi:Protein of unknown function (DUF1097)
MNTPLLRHEPAHGQPAGGLSARLPTAIRSPRVAAAVAAAVLAGASVWVFAQTSYLLIWAAFIGWASFDSNGAGRKGAVVSTGSMLFGVAMAWLVALTTAGGLLPWAPDVSSAVAAAVASLLIVLASAAQVVSSVPSTFMGFASTFAFATLVKGAATTAGLTSAGWGNAGIAVAVSLVIGTGLGIVHGELARLLRPRKGEAARARGRLDGSRVHTGHAAVTATTGPPPAR